MVKIDLKGQIKEFENGVTAAEVAKSIGMGLYKSACAARIDGEVCDLRAPIDHDCTLEILTFDSEEGKQALADLQMEPNYKSPADTEKTEEETFNTINAIADELEAQ